MCYFHMTCLRSAIYLHAQRADGGVVRKISFSYYIYGILDPLSQQAFDPMKKNLLAKNVSVCFFREYIFFS